jgi:hypothetical protein
MGNKIQISVLAEVGNCEANTSSKVEAVGGPCPCALSLRSSSRPEQASSPQPLIGFAKMSLHACGAKVIRWWLKKEIYSDGGGDFSLGNTVNANRDASVTPQCAEIGDQGKAC